MISRLSNSRMIVWTVFSIASIFYAYQYVLRVMPNIMLDDIMQKYNIGAATFGQFSGFYYIGYSLMHLPIGMFLDRFGPKKVMTACVLFTVIGLLPLVFAEHWIFPTLGRALIGIGSSGAILGVFKIIRMTFSEKRFPRMLSISVTIGLIGAIYGGGPVNYMRDSFGFNFVIISLAVVGLILACVTYLIIPNIKEVSKTTVISDIQEVLKNKKVVLACIFAGLMVGPLEGFADVWGATYLKEVYYFDARVAASMTSMIFIGMCFGSPILSLIAEKVGSYLYTVIGAGVIMAIGFFFLLFTHLSSQILSSSFILIGVCCAYQILAIYKVSTFVKEHVVGLTTALANMIIMIFGYVFHTAIGGIVNILGGVTSSKAMTFGIAFIPVTLCIGTAGFVFLQIHEKRDKERAQLMV